MPITREEAALGKMVRYFTGIPCKYGHVAERFVSTRTCCECNSIRNRLPELKEFRRAYYGARYPAERDEILERGRRYNSTEAGRLSSIIRLNSRRSRKAAAEGICSSDDANRIRAAQGDRCAYCAEKLKGRGSLDHIRPLSAGGSNWPRNMQWLCRSCNSRKHTKDAIDFMREAGRLL